MCFLCNADMNCIIFTIIPPLKIVDELSISNQNDKFSVKLIYSGYEKRIQFEWKRDMNVNISSCVENNANVERLFGQIRRRQYERTAVGKDCKINTE